MNSILIQLQVRNVLYIQRVAELIRLVTGLRIASPVSTPAPPPALSPDVQRFDTSPRTEDAKERRREGEKERRRKGERERRKVGNSEYSLEQCE